CRSSAGICDAVENCDGMTNDCPADGKFGSMTICRASAGACDLDEQCTGMDDGCPADVKIPANTTCRAAGGDCDVLEACDGASDACPADGKKSASTECRASGGVCDVAENCDGATNVCPNDSKVTQGTTCRAVAGGCDLEEQCDGNADACPADVLIADGQGSDGALCDPYLCDGAMAACPNSCMNNGDCVIGGSCSGGVCISAAGETCRQVLQNNPNAASGNYLIDPDGAGGNPPYSAYCDMVKDGGGWTNIDFTANKVYLANGNFVQCVGGMSSSATSFTCTNPIFNNDANKRFYHYLCDGNDNSANYIKDHMGPLLGHRLKNTLGFGSQQQNYTSQTSDGTVGEYCYISGAVVPYDNAACNAYNGGGNGNCTPGVFTLSI
ncbi:MAG: fibrinogen-like YCDxxxxGGGW domain-containing protein, partial [Polyangiaceae bacterium]